MTNLVEKPKAGYQTPYQLVLDLTVSRILSRIDDQLVNGISLADRWVNITEALADITVPEEIQPETPKAHWKLTVTSSSRGIGTTPVRFYTFTLSEYLNAIFRQRFQPYTMNQRIIEEGFYYTEEKETILAVKSPIDFTKGIYYSDIVFLPSMYTVSSDGKTVFIDTPVVKGNLTILSLT